MANRKGVIAELHAFVSGTVKTLTINTTAALKSGTPKLTGHAQNNWIPSIGAPHPTPDGSRAAPSDSAQLEGIAKIIAFYRFPAIVYITNNVDYIVDLERGTSTKAPDGIVLTAIAKGIRSISIARRIS